MNLSTAGRDRDRDIVSDLVDYVRRQRYVRGDRLPSIRQLAGALGMGRNAVRDGVLQAQAMGLVKIEPRLGVFVQDPDAGPAAEAPARVLEQALAGETHNVFHLIDARLLVELELVGKAARAGHSEELLPLRQALEAVLADREDRSAFIEADEAFHLEIARLAGNPVLLSILRTLLGLLRPIKEGVLLSAENRQLTDAEHVELYRSLLEGNPEQAQAVMREHLAQGRTLLLEHLRTFGRQETSDHLLKQTP
jgi:GntR family transcriptional regulator, transcriptional repressor for pyruvate dehydrogenase complex